MIVFPFWLLTAFLALMLKWTLNLSAFVLALPMLYIFGWVFIRCTAGSGCSF